MGVQESNPLKMGTTIIISLIVSWIAVYLFLQLIDGMRLKKLRKRYINDGLSQEGERLNRPGEVGEPRDSSIVPEQDSELGRRGNLPTPAAVSDGETSVSDGGAVSNATKVREFFKSKTRK